MKDDDSKLIPELAEWNAGAGITLDSWISGVGRFDHALGYAQVFWPRFVQYENCIFNGDPDPKVYQDFMTAASGDCAKVEAVMNHIHLADLFLNPEFRPSRALLIRLGQIMKEMWSCKLAHDFPGKRFEISFTSDAEDLRDLELTFFQAK